MSGEKDFPDILVPGKICVELQLGVGKKRISTLLSQLGLDAGSITFERRAEADIGMFLCLSVPVGEEEEWVMKLYSEEIVAYSYQRAIPRLSKDGFVAHGHGWGIDIELDFHGSQQLADDFMRFSDRYHPLDNIFAFFYIPVWAQERGVISVARFHKLGWKPSVSKRICQRMWRIFDRYPYFRRNIFESKTGSRSGGPEY